MNGINQQRRNAHYGAPPKEPDEKKDYIKITIQLLVCMAILVFALYGNSYTLPHGETAGEFVRRTLSHNTDFSVAYGNLRSFVAKKFGTVVLPDPGESAVFNESTPTKPSE